MTIDLRKLNSITKYPSILTYHQLADSERNGLKEELVETSKFDDNEMLNVYEKIDGENARIVLIGDGTSVDYFIGSRQELLFAKGDRIGNPYGNIAEYFSPIADELVKKFKGSTGLVAIYFESYGGKTAKSKQYTNDRTQYGRVFDIFELSQVELEEVLAMDLSKIASWRDNGGQPYFDCEKREQFTQYANLPTAPLLTTLSGKDLPKDVNDVLEWLTQFKTTQVGINAAGDSEGVIVRTQDRKKITKIRFEDYNRTMRARSKK